MPELNSSPLETGHPRDPACDAVSRLESAAWAFTTRRVPRGAAHRILRAATPPAAGDLVLARVDAIGHHGTLQLVSGRRKHLFPGDEIVVTYANRYAPSQFEAVVPETLGPCHLVAGGGVAAKALSWHSRIAKGPTQITPLGLLADETGKTANLRDHALPSADRLAAPRPTTIAVVGTGMDAGKTQAAAFLVRGLTLAGVRVGFAKVTGTGAGNDTWLLSDAGADPVLDFTDAGLASTYLAPPSEIERVLLTLMAHVSGRGVGAIVLELADGLLQRETSALLKSPAFREVAGGILFAARDSMGAAAGADWLKHQNLPIVGLTGVLTSAPLQCEEASMATGLPVFRRSDLARASTAAKILVWAEEQKLVYGGGDAGSASPHDAREAAAAEEAAPAPRTPRRPEPGIPGIRPERRRA
jgi:hypothetical protein